MKLNELNVTVAALILICMSIVCHLTNYFYPKNIDKFYDTNTLYTLNDNGCPVLPPPVIDFTTQNEKDCSNFLKDPCGDVLEKSHWNIPTDISAQCNKIAGNSDTVSEEEDGTNSQLGLTDEEYQKILREYAFSEGRRIDMFPWFV